MKQRPCRHLAAVAAQSTAPLAAALAWVPVTAQAQAFVIDDSKIPFHSSITSDVELGDVDLDGDWDALIANGYEEYKDQSSIWINRGGLQGGELGAFADETPARLPQMQLYASDLALGDIDGDGDLDLHVSNASYIVLSVNRWWINAGGAQGGTLGYFEDETAAHWIGLGQPGSTVPLPIVQGSFIADCRDSEFADLDNDGDLDLIHTNYWLAAPHDPARLFLNDGAGHYQEFNPQGVVLAGPSGWGLQPGQPGIWCDGLYDNQTADATGTFCDPTTVTWDADAGDLDGDLDLDFVCADDWYDPGAFANRLEGSALAPAAGGGALGFRDVSGAVFQTDLVLSGNEDNCQELGDLDGDGDLDLAGSAYVGSVGSPSHHDGVFENASGALVLRTDLSSSGVEKSADLFDFDGDGDLDYMSSGGKVIVYENLGGFAFTQIPMPIWTPHPTLDADAADLDGDGDLDILAATDFGEGEHLLVNQTQVPDTHAPYIPRVEAVEDRTSSAVPLPVRAQVYDNAPHYVTAYNPTRVELAVDGVALPSVPALCSRGQVFRAALPGNLAGQVSYRFVSEDDAGNAGSSAELSFASSAPAAFQLPYGTATAGLAGGAPELRALSVPFAHSTLHLALSSSAAPGTLAAIGAGTQPLDPGIAVPGLLLLQVAGQVLVVKTLALDGAGDAVLSVSLGAVPAGATAYAQGFVLDATAAGDAFASSRGLALTAQ